MVANREFMKIQKMLVLG
jgi:hypothetical protein